MLLVLGWVLGWVDLKWPHLRFFYIYWPILSCTGCGCCAHQLRQHRTLCACQTSWSNGYKLRWHVVLISQYLCLERTSLSYPSSLLIVHFSIWSFFLESCKPNTFFSLFAILLLFLVFLCLFPNFLESCSLSSLVLSLLFLFPVSFSSLFS